MNQSVPNSEMHSPLSEPTYFILLSLAPKPQHGYAIIKSVQQLSQGRVRLSTGTLYGALQRLLEQGYISRIDEPQTHHPGRARRVYCLTHQGRSLLNAEVRRLHSLITVAQPLINQLE